MLKKVFLMFVFSMLLFGLMGCSANPKEFSGSGITITLTDSFFKKDVIQAPFYLESQDHIFMGMRETKDSLSPYSIRTLSEYMSAVLENGGVTAEIFTKDDGDVPYMYAYYSRTIGEMDFGYMLIVMEGENHFYTMNFGCLDEKLDDNKDQYFNWVRTITIE